MIIKYNHIQLLNFNWNICFQVLRMVIQQICLLCMFIVGDINTYIWISHLKDTSDKSHNERTRGLSQKKGCGRKHFACRVDSCLFYFFVCLFYFTFCFYFFAIFLLLDYACGFTIFFNTGMHNWNCILLILNVLCIDILYVINFD